VIPRGEVNEAKGKVNLFDKGRPRQIRVTRRTGKIGRWKQINDRRKSASKEKLVSKKEKRNWTSMPQGRGEKKAKLIWARNEGVREGP